MKIRLWEPKKGLKTAKNWSLTRRKIRVGVKTEFLRNWDAKWVLTQNVGSLGAVRAGKYPPAPPFWLLEPDFQSTNVGGAAFEGSLKTFLRDMDGVGEYFVAIFLPGTENLFFIIIEIFTICLLLTFFLDDPVD